MSLSSREPPYRLVFLLGVMRSGTTYLRNLLAANGRILALPGELTDFWTRAGGAPCGLVPRCPRLTAADRTPAAARAAAAFFQRCHRRRNSWRDITHRAYRRLRWGNESLFKRGRPLFVVNKSTHLVNKVPYLDAIFPQAGFIFLLRDIRSQVNSLALHLRRLAVEDGWWPVYTGKDGACWGFETVGGPLSRRWDAWQASLDRLPVYWLDQNRLALDDLDRLDPRRVARVHFTTLATRPETVLETLEPLFGGRPLSRKVSRRLINNATRDPLNAWRTDLAPARREAIERLLTERAADYRFICSRVPIGPPGGPAR